jgi:hypothetical protein
MRNWNFIHRKSDIHMNSAAGTDIDFHSEQEVKKTTSIFFKN